MIHAFKYFLMCFVLLALAESHSEAQPATEIQTKQSEQPKPKNAPDLSEEETITAIKALGGTVEPYEFDDGQAGLEVKLSAVRQPRLKSALEHLEGLASPFKVTLDNAAISDTDLKDLPTLDNLKELSLKYTTVTSEGLKHLQGLTHLEILRLNNTHVDETGLEHLKGLTNLKYLALAYTKVTDDGLIHLQGLTNLRVLGLSHI